MASGDKERDQKVVKSVLSDILEDSLTIVKERKKHQMGKYPKKAMKRGEEKRGKRGKSLMIIIVFFFV